MSKYYGLPSGSLMSERREGLTCRYDLIGVINHLGGTSSGHYIAYINHSSHPENELLFDWHCYNDSLVTPLKEHHVEDNRDAYVLFYQLRVTNHSV